MYLKLIANSLDQFLVDSYFGPGDLEMGTVVREDYDLVTPREFVWTYHSLLIKKLHTCIFTRVNLTHTLCIHQMIN